MFRQPLAYPAGGPGTGEMSHFLTMVEQHDSGKAPQCVAPREFHILALVNFHFDQQHLAIELVYSAADMRCYGMAWPAPVCPEIHHHRPTLRCLDYLFPEIVQPCFGDPLALFQLVHLAKKHNFIILRIPGAYFHARCNTISRQEAQICHGRTNSAPPAKPGRPPTRALRHNEL